MKKLDKSYYQSILESAIKPLHKLFKRSQHDEEGDYDEVENRSSHYEEEISQLRLENQRISAEIKYLEDQNYNLLAQKERDAHTLKRYAEEINKLKKLIKEKEIESQKLAHLRPNPHKEKQQKYERYGWFCFIIFVELQMKKLRKN